MLNANSLPGGWLESGHGSISIFVKDFRDPLARKKKLILKPWAAVKDVKDQLQVVFNVPSNVQKLYFNGRELKNQHNLQQCGIYQDNVVIDFVARRANNLAFLYGADADAAAAAAACSSSSSSSSSSFAASKRTPRGGGGGGGGGGGTVLAPPTKPPPVSPPPVSPPLPAVNIHPYGAYLLPVSLMKVLHQSLQGLALGLAPVLAMDGTGGTYFLKDPSHRSVGCFKPQDEEPFGPNNPRGLVGELGQSGLRRGILSGEACERELAAYLLDRDHFAGVPATSLVEARHPVFKYQELAACHFKMGSLQEFVRHDDVASDLAPSQFSAHQVHKVVLLDMRLLNTDRNDANILVRKRRSVATPPQVEYELIPIDHGYCLPQFLEIAWCDWCWFNWPQLATPLSTEDRAYVLRLNPVEDADKLAKKIPLRRACRRNMVIAGTIVQKGVKADLLLYDIAKIMCRDDLDAPSTLERLCLEAFQLLQRHRNKENGTVAAAAAATTTDASAASSRSSSPRANGASASASSSRFSSLRISTDVGPAGEPHDGDDDESNSGARSPPGFWASYTPFSTRGGKKWSWADDSDDDDDYTYLPFQPLAGAAAAAAAAAGSSSSAASASPPANATKTAEPPAANSRQSSFVKWDDIAATALSNAADGVDANGQNTKKTKSKHDDEDDDDRASVLSSAFGNATDKDEFEVLNEALDANPSDEKLFLGILGRLMDEKISECVRQQRKQAASASPSTTTTTTTTRRGKE